MSPKLQERALDRASRAIPGIALLGGAEGARRTARAMRDARHETGGTRELTTQIARSLPEVARLLWRIARDGRVPLRYRVALWSLVPYLLSPIDLIPDFIPGVGAMDDALLVATLLRWVVRGVGEPLLREHWSGEPQLLELLLRMAGTHGRS